MYDAWISYYCKKLSFIYDLKNELFAIRILSGHKNTKSLNSYTYLHMKNTKTVNMFTLI